MSFDLQINVFTIVFMLMLFLGLQIQISGLGKKIDQLLKR